ncbi:tetratricopeptide repeat protein [Microbacterium gorillae]|uniref:tetratricopeptide repeat protein n=1 Tax=Microbacterium gorillae TaxID=1231063 RepID=UPI0005903176|nr:tetratricopeptide repeat protein [Microbacterium gorillae]
MTDRTETRADDRTAAAADELLRINRGRRRIRRWTAIAAIPLLVIAALLATKIVSMYVFAHGSITSYLAGDGEGTTRAAGGQRPLNIFEPYKAPFNAGDGLALSDKLPESRAEFEEALRLATGVEVCPVRINLALIMERQGDALRQGGDPAAAQPYYQEALTVLADMPEECSSKSAQQNSSDPNRDMGDSADQARKRVQEKSQSDSKGTGEKTEQPTPSPSESSGPSQKQLDELDHQLEEGQQERDERNEGDGGEPRTDKPW